jgi:hypothetical protein
LPSDRLRRVSGDVQEDLNQLFPITHQFRQAGIVVAADPERGRKLRGEQAAHALEDLVDVHRAGLHRAVRRQQAAHQILQTVGLLDDHLGVFAQAGIVEFPFEQLRCTSDAAERVLDFVHQVSYQFAVGVLLLDQALFPCGPKLLIYWPKLDKKRGSVGIYRVHRAIQLKYVATSEPQLDVLPGIAPAVMQNAVQGREQLRRALHDALQRAAGEDLVADLQQVLGGRIQVADCQALVEENNRRRQQVKATEWIPRILRHQLGQVASCPKDQRRLAISFRIASILRWCKATLSL